MELLKLNPFGKLTGQVQPYNWLVDAFGAADETKRKGIAQRLYDYYVGDKSFIRKYTLIAMAVMFKSETLQQMRFPYRNIVPKVIKRTSLAYKTPAIRYCVEDAADEVYQEMLESSNINTQAKEWNRLAKLLDTVYVQVIWRNDRVEYDLYPPHLLTVKADDVDYMKPVEVVYQTVTGGALRYIVWTGDDHVILDKDKKVFDTPGNPYGVLPFIPCRLRPTEDHWGEGDQQLVDIQEEGNVLLASTFYNALMQSHGQAVGVNLGLTKKDAKGNPEQQIATGPDKIIQVEGAMVGEVTPTLFYAQPTPSIEPCLLLVDNMLKSAAVDRGLSADSVSIETIAQSGAAKAIDNFELLENREDDIEALRAFEGELFRVSRIVWNYHAARKIPGAATFGIDFDPVNVPTTEKEELEVKEKKYPLGLWTPVDDMVDEDAGIDEVKALELVKRNLEIKRELEGTRPKDNSGDQPFGAANGGTPQGDQGRNTGGDDQNKNAGE